MTTLVITLFIAAILILLAACGLAIGLILTGKSRLRRLSCGRNPKQQRDENCGTDVKCSLCERDPPSKAQK